MTRYLKIVVIAVLAVLSLAPAASAQRRAFVFRGGIGPGWGWYYPYPYGWGWGPAYGYEIPATGDVKVVSAPKDASVYIDGGYAGRANKLKKFSLSPGTYDLELRDSSGHSFYQERIRVISGKTVEVNAGHAG